MHVAAEGSAAAGFERALDQACGDWMAAAPACALLACGMIGHEVAALGQLGERESRSC